MVVRVMADMAQNTQPDQDPASQVLALNKKKSRLSGMDMPGASTAPTEDGLSVSQNDQAADPSTHQDGQSPIAATTQRTGAPGYTDPDTGEITEREPGAEEGDLYLDYVSPVKSLFTGGLAAAGNIVANKGLNYLKNKMPGKSGNSESGLDYSKMDNPAAGPGQSGYTLQYGRGQQGMGTTTDATTGFKKTPGIRYSDK